MSDDTLEKACRKVVDKWRSHAPTYEAICQMEVALKEREAVPVAKVTISMETIWGMVGQAQFGKGPIADEIKKSAEIIADVLKAHGVEVK